MTYRQDIDGLRGLAILLTIFYHAFPKAFPNGYLGVDIFFVISGFLITCTILDQLDLNNFSIINFYCRRIKRILPPALLVLSVVTLLGTLTLFQNEYYLLRKNVRTAAVFLLNFELYSELNYFSFERIYRPVVHFWSLAIEEQFYLFWPIVIFLSSKMHTKLIKKIKYWDLFFIFITLILLLPSFFYFLLSDEDLYFSTFARVWEILLGCLAAFIYHYIYSTSKSNSLIFRILSVLASFSIVALAYSQFLNEKKAIILSTLSVFFLLISPNDIFVKNLLKFNILVKVGLMSFSLYLWHWPIISFYNIYKIKVSLTENLILIFITFLISWLTFYFVESKLKKLNWDLVSEKRLNFNIYKVAMLIFCIIVSAFLYAAKIPKIPDLQTSEMIYIDDSELDINSDCKFTDHPGSARYQKWCYSENIAEDKKGLIIGDSQAHALYRGFTIESIKSSWSLVSAESCPPFELPDVYDVCTKIISDTFLNFKKFKDFKYIVFVMSNQTFKKNINQFNSSKIQNEIIDLLRNFHNLGKSIFIVRPVPEFPTNIGFCSRQRFSFYKVFDHSHLCSLDGQIWKEQSLQFNNFLNFLKSKVPQIEILDFNDILCDEKKCSVIVGSKSMYQDNSHLSFEGNKQAARRYLKIIENR